MVIVIDADIKQKLCRPSPAFLPVPGDPSDVCGTEIDVLFVIIEDVFEGGGGIKHVAACRVQHSLWFARAATGV